MSAWRLIFRSLWFHRRMNVGVVVGVAIATAVIVGAMVVGDSVRRSLREMALARIGSAEQAMQSGNRFFTVELARGLGRESGAMIAPVLALDGIASSGGGARRASGVKVLGVEETFWRIGGTEEPTGTNDPAGVILNERLAAQLEAKVGDRVVLRVAKPSALPRDMPLGSEVDDSVALSVTVRAVVGDGEFGRFSLEADQIPPFNAMVPLKVLQERSGVGERANMMLAAGGRVTQEMVKERMTLGDAGLRVAAVEGRSEVELRSERVFMDDAIVEAAAGVEAGGGEAGSAEQLLTYFVNELRSGERATPYSMVTGMETVEGRRLGAGEMVVTRWLADDLKVEVGGEVVVRYWVVGTGRELIEREAKFEVVGITATEGGAGDRAMMPDFAGLSDVESSRDWNPGIPIDLARIREVDEAYWKEHRGTPKAFVSLEWAKANWGNRFGSVTAVRWDVAGMEAAGLAEARERIGRGVMERVGPEQVGLFFRDVRSEALAASSGGTDFGGLFIGLSLFLVAAALLLTAMLVTLGAEQRTSEQGLLLAVGMTPGEVRRVMMIEGAMLAVVGSGIGAAAGIGYTQGVLWALGTVWSGAVAGASGLRYHAEVGTVIIGAVASLMVAVVTMWMALRRAGRQPVRAMLAARYGFDSGMSTRGLGRGWGRGWGLWAAAGVCMMGAAGLAAAGLSADAMGGEATAGSAFGAGALLLMAGLLGTAAMLRRASSGNSKSRLTLTALGWRGMTRRRGRSVATVTLVACGVFLVVSINAFRQSEDGGEPRRESGTGGFALYGQTALAVHHDLNTAAGREAMALGEEEMAGVSVVAMRVREGDEASCLNLNQPRRPALAGVDAKLLAERGAFKFVRTLEGESVSNPWWLLAAADDEPEAAVPAIVDDAVAQWIIKRGLGDEIEYTDEGGQRFRVKIVGTLGPSVLQGSIVISERQFVRRFPSSGGYRLLLIDAPWERAGDVKRILERSLADYGLTTMTTPERLAIFAEVQNTYLTIFSVLGGLGLVLGGGGLGIVVMRNVMERRGEMATLRAIGFSVGDLRRLIFVEHALLLTVGMVIGLVASVVAIWPAMSQRSEIPLVFIGVMLGGLLVTGLGWAAAATLAAVRGRLTEALRGE